VISGDLRIRRAEPTDFPEVAEMHYAVWRRSWAGILTAPVLDILGPAKRWAAQIYPQTLSRAGWSMWVAESGGRAVGVVIFGPDDANPDEVQVDALYIAEESQRHGLGGLLLEKVLSLNPSNDVILWCAERNAKGRRFYEKNQFRADGRTLVWEPLPDITVNHDGYRLRRR